MMKRRIILWITAAAIAAVSGCSNSPTSTYAADNSTVPSFADVNRSLKLDDADAAIVKTALAEWKRGANTQNAGAPGFANRRQEMEFVATVARSLDDQQLSSLASLLLSRREAHRDDMRAHRRGMRGDQMKMMSKELALTDSQQKQLKALHEETRAKADAQRKSFAGGGVDEDQLRAALQAIHTDARAKMETILTTDQMKKLDAMRDERFENRMERRVDNSGKRDDTRLAWLVRTFELSDGQAAQVRTALTTLSDAQDASFNAVKSGSLTRDQAQDKMRAARAAFAQSLKEILSAEQSRRLDILQPLIPGRIHHA